jgi:hypothetical protein
MSNTGDKSAPTYRSDLGGGLVVRWSTGRDTDAMAELCSHVFRRKADEPPNHWVAAWLRSVAGGSHPHGGPGEFAVVEDAQSGRIVSSACLLSYEVEIEGIALPFGRPEIVATHPAYRNRGLVRATFELLHARSASRGHLLQGITGIPYYYRLFGYEYAADLGGEVSVYFAAIPPLEAGQAEAYRLRPAAPSELNLVKDLYDLDRSRYALSTPIPREYLRWAMAGLDPRDTEGWTVRLITDAADAVHGYALIARARDADDVKVFAIGTARNSSLAAVLPSVLRGLRALAHEPVPRRADLPAPARLCLMLWRDHPAYRLLAEGQVARSTRPYAWYLRVPDLPALLLRIAALLERRLAASPVAGYTGDLRLSFYRNGLRLVFDRGRLASVEDWREDHSWGPRAQAGFPPLVFLKLVFGHRSLGELREAFPDVNATDEARPILEALFPPRPTWLLPLD